MITEHFKNVKNWCQDNKSDLFTAAVIFLSVLASFGLGRLSLIWPQKTPIQFKNTPPAQTVQAEETTGGGGESTAKNQIQAANILNFQGKFVASKSGMSYHYPWCPGAQKIKEENKVWFQTKEEAENRGYKPAGNCQGL